MKQSIGFASLCAQELQDNKSTNPHQLLIYATSSFEFDGNGVAGVIIGRDIQQMKAGVFTTMKLAGTNCNAGDAWLINNGL